jgi:ethylbenzene dehydrogenase
MKSRLNSVTVLLLISLMLIFFISSPRPVVAQNSVATIVSYRVNGAPDYNAPGNESFWKNIGWTDVSLSASVSPGGGHTSDVLVKSANDGYNIYALFRWSDPQGPSFGSSSEEYVAPNGTIVPLNFSDTGAVKQLYYNITDNYYYPDRVAMLWFLKGPIGEVPAMQLNTTGAITNGTANIWHWQSVPTDNVSFPTSLAGNYTDQAGKTIFPPNNSSFAEDDFTNETGFFPIAGSISGAPNLDPSADPFIILAGNSFSTTNKTWTVEMVRPLIEPQASNYRVQLSVGTTYFVGFAVWNGKTGESAHIKSVSQWYKLTVSNEAAPSPAAPAAGISLVLAMAAGAGLLIAGLIVGVVLRPEKKKPGS